MEDKRKDLHIETLRGIAIVLMVAGHVIGDDSSAGMKVKDDSILRYVYYMFEYLRMPLFTVISGYVYSLRPVTKDSNLLDFLRKKASRLLIPFITCATLFFLVQYFTPGTNTQKELSDIWRIYFFSYAHFWFIQSIFVIFIVVAVVENLRLMTNAQGWLICLIVTVVFYFSNIYLDFFSLTKTFYLLPYFVLGVGLYRFKDTLLSKKLMVFVGSLFIITFAIQQIVYFSHVELGSFSVRILKTFVGFSGITFFVYTKFISQPLIRLGYYSFMIYLYHVFGTAGVRIILSKFGVQNDAVLFLACLLFGLVVPIILYNLARFFTPLRLVLFGERINRKKVDLAMR